MPDHEIEGADYTTINSHRAFKDTPPATVDSAADYNSVWRGLMRLLLDSGVGLAASAAAAQAEDWVRILTSVRRISRRTTPTTVTMASTPTFLTPNLDVHAYNIDESTSLVNGQLRLSVSGQTEGRILNFYNMTNSNKDLADAFGSTFFRIAPNSGVAVICLNLSGLFWAQLCAINSDQIAEGSNLYWTNARFDARFASSYQAAFDAALAAKTTTDLAEGSNLYWTNARFDARFITNLGANFQGFFDTSMAAADTGDLAEGSNLYFTNARGDARANAQIDVRFGAAIQTHGLELRQTRTDSLVETATLRYKYHDGVTHVELPFISATINESDASPTGLRFSGPSGATFPTALRMDELMDLYDDTFERSRFWIPALIIFNGVREIGSIRPSQIDGYWALFHENGSADWSTDNNNYALYVAPLSMTFFGGV